MAKKATEVDWGEGMGGGERRLTLFYGFFSISPQFHSRAGVRMGWMNQMRLRNYRPQMKGDRTSPNPSSL